ncbi:MAG: response regulator [Alteromonadaceae bacterium]|nr:response regulator [Alteromonadaceae bacterium]
MAKTGRYNFRTVLLVVLLLLAWTLESFAVEPAWMGKRKFDGEATGIVRDITSVGHNTFIGAENGLFHIVGNYSKHYSRENSPLGLGYITSLHHDNGTIYIAEYGNGVFTYSLATGEFERLLLPKELEAQAWAVNLIEDVVVVSTLSKIILVTREGLPIVVKDASIESSKLSGMYSIAGHNKEIIVSEANSLIFIDLLGEEKKVLSRQAHFPQLAKITYVKAFGDELYIGGIGGVYRYDIAKRSSKFFPINEKSSKLKDVESILVDKNDELWVAAGGLFLLDRLDGVLKAIEQGLPKYSFDQVRAVQAVHQLDNGDILIASTQLGLFAISEGSLAINYIHETEFPYRKDIYAVTALGKSRYLARTSDRWFELNAATGRLTAQIGSDFDSEPIPLTNNKVFSPQTCSIYSLGGTGLVREKPVIDARNFCPYIRPLHYIKNDSKFIFYQAPTHAGLVRYADNTITHFANAPKNVRFITSQEGMPVVIMDSNNALYTMEGHGVWIKHDIKALKSVYVYCLYADPVDSAVYFCTSGRGLKRYSLHTKKLSDAFVNFNVPRFIRDGYLDSTGHHWLATNKGLVVVNRDYFFDFEQSDGIVDTDFNYQGILPLDPEQFLLVGDQLSYVVNTLKLTSYVKRRRQHTAYASILNVRSRSDNIDPITVSKNGESYYFTVQPEELMFEFASADFIYSHLQHVEYRLAGLNPTWQALPTNIGTVAYSGLGVGEFDFQVRVIDSKSVNPQPISHYRFEIPVPLWQSWQAYLIYLCALCAVVWLSIKWYRWHLAEKSRTLQYIIDHKQSALLDSNRSISQLLTKKERIFSNLAKEIRTPVMRILIPLTELRQQNQTTAVRKSLDLIFENAARLRALVEQLIAVQRIDHISEQKKQTYDVEKTLKYIIETHRPAALKKKLSISLDNQIKGSILVVQDSLETMISHLLVNAICCTQDGGHIKVKAKQIGEQFTFEVIDNGIGISIEDVDFLISRFAEGTNYTGKAGMGIGLNLVNQLALANDGWIEIHSEPEVGTTVCIHLPCDVIVPVAHVQQSSDKVSIGLKVAEQQANYTNADLPVVLIVDNSQDASDYLIEILRERYNCYSVQQGWKALELIPVITPELVITELNIQDISGAELTQKIRALEEFADLPVMILTAQTEHSAKITSFKATVSDYLIKPVERDELIWRIESNLAISRLSHQTKRRQPHDEDAADNLTYVQSILPLCRTDKDRKFIVNLLDVVERHYTQETFNRSQAAKELAMSERTLNRIMAEFLPDNFALFLKKYRLEKSLPLLKAGYSMMQIALEVGFGSAAYYSRCFKQEYGHLPKDIDLQSEIKTPPDNT